VAADGTLESCQAVAQVLQQQVAGADFVRCVGPITPCSASPRLMWTAAGVLPAAAARGSSMSARVFR